MSLLSESLERHLEAVKREQESPLVKGLRAEIAKLTKNLKFVDDQSKAQQHEIDQLHDHMRYPNKIGDSPMRRQPFRMKLDTDVTRSPVHDDIIIGARMTVGRDSLRGYADEMIFDEVYRQLAHELSKGALNALGSGPRRAQEGLRGPYQGLAMPMGLEWPEHMLKDTQPTITGVVNVTTPAPSQILPRTP